MYQLIQTQSEFFKSLTTIHEYLKNVANPKLALDLETYSNLPGVPRPILKADGDYEGYISLLQIGLDPNLLDIQFLYDVRALSEEFLEGHFDFLEDVTIIGQNLKYDWAFLKVHLGIKLKKIRDVMLISQILYAGDKRANINHSLLGLYKRFIPQEHFKSLSGMDYLDYIKFKKTLQASRWDQELTADQLKYASDDVRLPFYVLENQFEQIKEFIDHYKNPGILEIIKLENNLVPIFSMMELRGFQFDIENHTTNVIPFLKELLEKERAEVAKYFKHRVTKVEYGEGLTKAGKPKKVKIKEWEEEECINLNSPKQVKEALEPFCGELESTDYENLLYRVDQHPAILHILNYRTAAKLLSTYGENLVKMVHSDGRLHPSWFQIGSDDMAIDTGRSSCKDPNIMNVPSGGEVGEKDAGTLIRSSYIARPGYSLIDVDVNNMEGRLMADYTNDPILVKAFKNDEDLHSITAHHVLELDYFPKKETSDPQEKSHRSLGKEIFLALQYQMGIKKFITRMFVNTQGKEKWEWDEAKQRRSLFAETYVGISEAQKAIRSKIEAIFEPHNSLVNWKSKGERKVIYMGFTRMGRPRRWCLSDRHEDLAWSSRSSELHKDSQVLRDGKYTTFGNDYNSRKEAIIREAFNQPIQGSASDLLKSAQFLVDQRMHEAGVFDMDTEGLIACVHDELLIEVKNENIELGRKILAESLLEIGKRFIKRVPVKIDTGVGDNWAEVH